ncbi:MAG: hypothetical protein N2515_06545, partial [Deltaproteobacteria bacterium]|nr:hypothetical protein [Deltaproteobacteria bacterium]
MKRDFYFQWFWLNMGFALVACDGGPAGDLVIEALPTITPSLPQVPTLPPPPYPIQYPDGSYSVYGIKRKLSQLMDREVTVTAYIAEIYTPPECPKGQTCPPPAAPHLWLSDAKEPNPKAQRLLLVGYAESQAAIEEAIAKAKRGRPQPSFEETGIPPIPTDFALGNKIKVSGRLTRIAASGFSASEGLIEYKKHETLEV